MSSPSPERPRFVIVPHRPYVRVLLAVGLALVTRADADLWGHIRFGLDLLRDRYLPAKVCEVLMGAEGLHQINVSRFTAIASSLQTKADVVQLLTSSLSESSMPAMAKPTKDVEVKVRKPAGGHSGH